MRKFTHNDHGERDTYTPIRLSAAAATRVEKKTHTQRRRRWVRNVRNIMLCVGFGRRTAVAHIVCV